MKHFMKIAAVMLLIAFTIVPAYILYIHSPLVTPDITNNTFEIEMLEEERRIIQSFIESEHTDPKDIPKLQERYLFLSEQIDGE